MAPKAAGFVVIFRLYLEGVGRPRAALGARRGRRWPALTIVAGNLMAIPQQNIKRLLAYSGIAHIGYMLVGLRRGLGVRRRRWCSSIWSPTSSATWARSSSWRRVARSEGSESDRRAIAAWRSARRVLALAMLLFLLSLGGIPFVAGFWAKLYVFWAAAEQGLYWLVLLGAVLTVVALFYYLLVAKRMYIDAPEKTAPVTAPFLLTSRSSSAWSASWARRLPEAPRHGRPPRRLQPVLGRDTGSIGAPRAQHRHRQLGRCPAGGKDRRPARSFTGRHGDPCST